LIRKIILTFTIYTVCLMLWCITVVGVAPIPTGMTELLILTFLSVTFASVMPVIIWNVLGPVRTSRKRRQDFHRYNREYGRYFETHVRPSRYGGRGGKEL